MSMGATSTPNAKLRRVARRNRRVARHHARQSPAQETHIPAALAHQAMTIDPSITLGALLNAVVLIVGFTVAFTRIGGRIDLLAQRLSAVEDAVKATRDFTERLAVTETRQATHGQMIVNMQSDIRDMKKGRGFVVHRSDDGVNGEYP